MSGLEQLARYRFAGKSERAVREEWIAPLLVELGYGAETLHEIWYEVSLSLAKPFRRIGRQRVSIDYVPTVLGRGLWIIEAKAAESEDWDDAISQAWLYATHPEVDVPFMVIADGSRVAVYDTTRADWDDAEVDIPVAELAKRFGELKDCLGAARVTRAIRTRRLRHLEKAMHSELSTRRLDEYVTEVRRAAHDARSSVLENQRAIFRDQHEQEERQERDALEVAGLFAVGVWANQSFGVPKRMMGLGRDALLREPPDARWAAYTRMLDGARSGRPRVLRETWNLRLVRLFIALTCSSEEGCGFLEGQAEAAIRGHLLNFPDDPLARAARRFERVLPAYAGRLVRANGNADLNELAARIQEHWSDETKIRIGLSGGRLYVDRVGELVRQIWDVIPWQTRVLDGVAARLETDLEDLEVATSEVNGPAGDPHFEFQYRRDMLEMATLYEVGSLIRPEHLSLEVVEHLKQRADEDADTMRIIEPARRLIAAYEGAFS